MGIKKYPLEMLDTKLEQIRAAAKKEGSTIKKFIFEAIEEKMEKQNEEKAG